ncbi:MAG: helix-turn-helix transcriptional regulator [Peptococcaceae bacterium]
MEYGVYDRAFRQYCHSYRGKEEGSCTVYRIENKTGRGELFCHDVFPGAQIIFNSLQLDTYDQKVRAGEDFLQINHCLEGCFEVELNGDLAGFLGEGDLAVNDPGKQPITNFRLPLGRYKGITLLFELEPAQRVLKGRFPDSGIDLYLIREKLCSGKELFLLRGRPETRAIFNELNHVDERVQEIYTLLKIVELLLFLSLMEDKTGEALPRFSRQVVEGTKGAWAFIMARPFKKTTIPELAGKFKVAETSLRQCFKSVYGQPIGSFIRSERIRRSAQLLQEHGELSVGQIALMVGYENQSKFAAAFKAVMGQTPLSYRRRNFRLHDRSELKLADLEWRTF